MYTVCRDDSSTRYEDGYRMLRFIEPGQDSDPVTHQQGGMIQS